MSSVSLEEIKAFTVEELWDIRGGITEQSALAHDFGIAGRDGKEFMEKFATRFGVELAGFDWIDFFGPESPGSPLGFISYFCNRFVKGIQARDLVGLPEITLGHLVDCANRGAWFAPEENA